MIICNNALCPRLGDCERHEKHHSKFTEAKHHEFVIISGRFACDNFLYKAISENLNENSLKNEQR
jgi:hypothetical protein